MIEIQFPLRQIPATGGMWTLIQRIPCSLAFERTVIAHTHIEIHCLCLTGFLSWSDSSLVRAPFRESLWIIGLRFLKAISAVLVAQPTASLS